MCVHIIVCDYYTTNDLLYWAIIHVDQACMITHYNSMLLVLIKAKIYRFLLEVDTTHTVDPQIIMILKPRNGIKLKLKQVQV